MTKAIRIYLGIKFHEDFSNSSRVDRILSVVEGFGHQVYCMVRDDKEWGGQRFSAHELMQKAFSTIDECQVVIIDITEKGVGVGIEAGYAYAKGIPVIVIAENDAGIPETLQGISRATVNYSTVESLRDSIIPIIRWVQSGDAQAVTC